MPPGFAARVMAVPRARQGTAGGRPPARSASMAARSRSNALVYAPVTVALPSWETAMSEDLLGKWALNLMLINVSTRRFGRAVRLPQGDISAAKGTGVSKSAVSRRFVAVGGAHGG